MDSKQERAIEDAFNSMLRTDYIPLQDTGKLTKLMDYYVDYLGFLRQIVSETDHLVVGRRGTGKTTLLYRGLIECISSWNISDCIAKNRTLGIYLDLSKCQSLEDTASKNFTNFEHVFATELYESIKQELSRSWPTLNDSPRIFERVFYKDEAKSKQETNTAIEQLANILESGIQRIVNRAGEIKETSSNENNTSYEEQLSLSVKSTPKAGAATKRCSGEKELYTVERSKNISYRLSMSDILRSLGAIRKAANLSHIVIFIDEFSSLNRDLQRRFSSLLRKIVGNHSGVFVKVCAITDNYTLGSSIILQRDLFELNLDLDSYVERSGSLGAAMRGLDALTNNLITERVASYTSNINIDDLFENYDYTVKETSIAAMGVPRTIGIILKQAYYRTLSENKSVIRKTDIDYGIKYASRAYADQFIGSCGIAIPSFYKEIWDALLERAIIEREKSQTTSSHFMVLPKNEEKLKYFNMFFIVHLLTQGRTTKKEKASRSLFCFDYGICIENNISYGTDKNVLRQQRFAYDDTLDNFQRFFTDPKTKRYRCSTCSTIYNEKELFVAGIHLGFCPKDRSDLEEIIDSDSSEYTEEEIKIIGAIRSSTEEDELLARQVADDVGCYVQKVAKFGEKLERECVIKRKMKDKYIYFNEEGAEQKH